VVIELKRDAEPQVVLNNLYKMTSLESSFSVNSLAIDQGRPKVLNIKELMSCYIEHRRQVVIRRTRYLLRKAEERAEILEGYLIALDNLDDFIRIIRTSSNRDEARVRLMAYNFSPENIKKLGILIRSEARLKDGRYHFTSRQINAILDLRLYQLTGMERDKISDEYKELISKINDYLDILAKEYRVKEIIKQELRAVAQKYSTPRRTKIVADIGDMAIEDLIANEGVIITMTHKGFIKRTNTSTYRSQRRGGKGVLGMATRSTSLDSEEDFIERLFPASTHDYLLFFTNTGRVYMLRVHEIPDMGRAAKGRSIANLLNLQADEKIAALIRIESKVTNGEDTTMEQPYNLFFATRRGTVKKTALNQFVNMRKSGIRAINIDEGDELIDVKLTTGTDDVVIITRESKSIRFNESEVREMGRATMGVRGILLEAEDRVIGLAIVEENATLLVTGEKGVGKRTTFDDYRQQARGGKGVLTMKISEKTGKLVGALTVKDSNDIMLITRSGQMVRIHVSGISSLGRITQGVKLINLAEGDLLQAIAPVAAEEKECDEEEGEKLPLFEEDSKKEPPQQYPEA